METAATSGDGDSGEAPTPDYVNAPAKIEPTNEPLYSNSDAAQFASNATEVDQKRPYLQMGPDGSKLYESLDQSDMTKQTGSQIYSSLENGTDDLKMYECLNKKEMPTQDLEMYSSLQNNKTCEIEPNSMYTSLRL